MASKTLLELVNEVLLTTGDYSKLTTVINSPGDIAERIMNFLNMTIEDIERTADMPELRYDFSVTADGVNSIWDAPGPVDVRPDSAVIVTVDKYSLEEVTPGMLHAMKAAGTVAQPPKFFARNASPSGLLSIEIYPTPASGSQIDIVAYKRATPFTLSDTATTELMNNNLLVLGALAHIDAYDGMQRGYMQLYQMAKQDMIAQRFKNMQIRITPEDYR